jgi:hypothetical protein
MSISSSNRVSLALGLLLACCAQFMIASPAQAALTQTLDSVDVNNPTIALQMRFDEQAPRAGGFYDMSVTASDTASNLPFGGGGTFISCTRAANRDFICLQDGVVRPDGTTMNGVVRSWADAEKVVPNSPAPDAPKELFSCTDSALPLITRGSPCTGIATDPSGNFWLAGRNRKSSHSVIKVKPISQGGTCAVPYVKLKDEKNTDSDFCFAEYATGRPILEDIVYVGDKVGEDFVGPGGVKGPGVLIMENKLTVAFIPDREPSSAFTIPRDPSIIGETRTGWGLLRGEDLQSAAVLQRDVGTTGKQNFAVVTTNFGRLLAKRADGATNAFPVFDFRVAANRNNCTTATPAKFGVRTRYESNRAYVSDRACRQVLALETYDIAESAPPDDCSAAVGAQDFYFCNAREKSATGTDVDVALSTGTTDPTGISVSEGIGTNLNDCVAGSGKYCVLVPDSDAGDQNVIGARISNVTLDDTTKSGVIHYRITGIPDCRYYDDLSLASQKICDGAPADPVVGDLVDPNKQFLDVSKLLPSVIRKQFSTPEQPSASLPELPPMLLSPAYRAKFSLEGGDGTFEAIFGRTEEGLVFRKNFLLEIDAPELTGSGSTSDCGGGTPGNPDVAGWTVMTTISERYKVAGVVAESGVNSTMPLQHVEMLLNSACNSPTKLSGTRESIFPYNLAINPNVFPKSRYAPMPVGVGGIDTTSSKIDVFANLLVTLYDDLLLALNETARKDVDLNGDTDGSGEIDGTESRVPPIIDPTGASLASTWSVGVEDKLQKCIAAAYDKQSAAAQNCQSFESAVTNFRATVALLSPNGRDRANRLGEITARCDVILYVLNKQLLPTIPTGGFYYP